VALEFSVFLAGIRTQNWKTLYDSLRISTQKEFELIFVGPYGLPPELQDTPNVKFIEDWGCPSRCYQIGLLACTAPYVLFVADDGVFLNNRAIDNAFATLASLPPSKKNVISMKYHEGKKRANRGPSTDGYWFMRAQRVLRDMPFIHRHNKMIMCGLIDREYMIEMGGFDCRFKHVGLGCPDLAVRLQYNGANVILGDYFMEFNHYYGPIADHGPIHYSHAEEDEPLFISIWSNPDCMNRIQIDVNNWKDVPEVWDRRFPNGKVK
jgi:hypothetical protein